MSSNSYYSVDSILTDNEKTPCTFDLDVPLLGVLNNGSKVENGTKLELPLWIAEMLTVLTPAGDAAGSLATIDMPAVLGPLVLNALRAGPKSVNLKQQSPFFYGIGEKMLDLFDDEAVAEVLDDTFKQRALEIADKAQSAKRGDEFIDGLEEYERKLLKASHDGSKGVKDWFTANRM